MLRKLVRHVLDNSSQPNTAKMKSGYRPMERMTLTQTSEYILEKEEDQDPGIKVSRAILLFQLEMTGSRNKEVQITERGPTEVEEEKKIRT